MNLILKIVNNPSEAINSASHEFKKEGGTLGRSSECTWVLNDRQETLSRIHAEIEYKGGGYYLIDTSTNGILYKQENRRVPPKELVRLYEGEVLSMGEYDILVGFVKAKAGASLLNDLLNKREIDIAVEENLIPKKQKRSPVMTPPFLHTKPPSETYL